MSAEDHSDCAVTSTTTCSPLHSPTPQAGRMEGVGGQQMPSWLTWPATTAGLATGEDRDSTATATRSFGQAAPPLCFGFTQTVFGAAPTPQDKSEQKDKPTDGKADAATASVASFDDLEHMDDSSEDASSGDDEDDRKPTSTVNTDCTVCGPGIKATGYHFGALTCEACKAFFRRTVRKDVKHSCRLDRACEINKDTRNQCPYCRYQKCIRMGMKRVAVQDGRGPKGRARGEVKSTDELVVTCPSANAAVPMPAVSGLVEVDFFQELPTEDASIIVKNMIDAERKTTERLVLPAYAPESAGSLNEVVQAFRALFLDVINWAKLLTEFDELGSKEFQADALRVTWMDLATFSLATRSQPGDRLDSIFISAQHVLSRDACFDDELGRLIGRLIDELVIPFRSLNLCDMEKACIRGILFFCPEKHLSKSTELSSKMRYYQESLMGELQEYCTVPLRYRKAKRYGKVLLRIAAINSISAELFRYFMLHDRSFFNARGNSSGGTSYGVSTVLNTMLLLPLEA